MKLENRHEYFLARVFTEWVSRLEDSGFFSVSNTLLEFAATVRKAVRDWQLGESPDGEKPAG